MTPALSREERAAEVLRKHRRVWYPDGAVGCDCEAVYPGGHEQHQAAMLAAAGLLADPDALDAAEAEVERLRRLLGMVPPPFVNDPRGAS